MESVDKKEGRTICADSLVLQKEDSEKRSCQESKSVEAVACFTKM